MEKIKSINWPLIVFILLGLRALLDASFAQAAVVLCFGTFVAVKQWLDSKKQKDVDAELRSELNALKNSVSGLVMKNTAKRELPENVRFF